MRRFSNNKVLLKKNLFLFIILFICASNLALADSASYSPPDYALDVVRSDGIPVGTVASITHDQLDDDWLKCDGSIYDTTKYPELFSRLGSNRVPDLRGRFLRGVDDGKGLDSGRTVLSEQGDAIRNITGYITAQGLGMNHGGYSRSGGVYRRSNSPYLRASNNGKSERALQINFDASRVVPTANENRPVNTALWLYIKGK